ncbi:MAG: class I SAM-dependent methyltransferase, partial [Fimbriimonadaceae bacterium]|nr:class I SAM-dependent methyltransferase [Fimbriimonadaceae bacterium]
MEREKERADSRRRQFATVRAVIPKRPADEFRYLNLGAGPGGLDELLLERFLGANATLVDGSLVMLDAASERLARFGGRVEYVQADLSRPEWTGAVGEGFDFAVSTIAIHNLRDGSRIRALYSEIHRLMGHGGMFLNLD